MCGRATLATPTEILRALFELYQLPALSRRYNIAPSQDLAIIREPHKLELMHWGLPDAGRSRGINVRAESVARAPRYRDAFRTRRCLVIVDGFFEWRRGTGKRKQPHWIHREDGQPFALAGIWERSGEDDDTCAIVTAAAQGVVADLHDRMPLILPPEVHARWLSRDERRPLDLLAPDASALICHPVSAAVNRPANDEPRLVEPVAPEPENLNLFDGLR
jgi:putative SOS response-associated peptidase YedK